MAGRLDIQEATGRHFYYAGRGHLLGYGNGAPTNSAQGFAPGAIYINYSSGLLYTNVGTFASSIWQEILTSNNTAGSRIITAITTLAVTKATHDLRTILLSLASGFTSTLPLATGSGARYKFVVGIVPTSNAYIIKTTSTDLMQGQIVTCSTGDSPDLAQPWITATDTNQINLGLSGAWTNGGFQIGDWIEFEDILTGIYRVLGFTTTNGTEVTPFSHV